MAYRIDSLPGRVPRQDVFHTLLDFLGGEIEALPEGWKVTWLWRNSRKSKLRSDSIENVIAKSRDSFMSLMQRRLERDLKNLSSATRGSSKRSRTKGKRGGKKKRPRRMSKVRKAKTRGRKPR
jgi:hypothetical protein